MEPAIQEPDQIDCPETNTPVAETDTPIHSGNLIDQQSACFPGFHTLAQVLLYLRSRGRSAT